MPASGSDEVDSEGNAVAETHAAKVARAQAYLEKVETVKGLDSSGENLSESQLAALEEVAAFEALLANYTISYTTGTLTVKHRTGNDRLALEVVGTTPEEGLTYTGKLQTVEGYTVNGTASSTNDEGTEYATFTLPAALLGIESASGDEAASESVSTPSWTLTGVSATGSGKDVKTQGDTTYAVTLTKGDVAIVDAAGNDVTAEFAPVYRDGSFEIVPIEMTLTAASVSRAYNTAELTAHTYTVTGGSFVRNEGLDENKIDWGASAITRVGSVVNHMNIENAWLPNTSPSNYKITVVDGLLEVLDHAEVADRLDAVVSAKSKQFEETGAAITLTGFTSEEDGYATFTVEANAAPVRVWAPTPWLSRARRAFGTARW
jgi:hypothetical protein